MCLIFLPPHWNNMETISMDKCPFKWDYLRIYMDLRLQLP